MAVRVPIGEWEGDGAGDACATTGDVENLLADGAFLRFYCHRMLGDPHAAEDIVQETFLHALTKPDGLDRRASFAPWLATVARRRSANEIRRRVRLDLVSEFSDDTGAPIDDPADVVSTADILERARAAFECLSPRERRLLERQVYDGLSIEELVAEDGTTRSSVKSVLNRARAKIRSAVDGFEAHVLLPVAGLANTLRRHLSSAAERAQRVPAGMPAGFERAAEALAVVVATVGMTVAAPPAVATDEPAQAPVPERVSVLDADPAASETIAEPWTFDGVSAVPPAGDNDNDDEAVTAEQSGSGVVVEDESDEPNSPLPITPPAPDQAAPEPKPPVDPDEPVRPSDEAEEPDDASFRQLAWPGGSASTTSSGNPAGPDGASAGPDTHDAPDGSMHVFGLGQVSGVCRADCTVLFRSDDGGATWTKVAAEGLSEPRELLVAPAYPDDPRVFAMGRSGLSLSTDHGESFAPVSEPHSGPAAMAPGFSEGDERILIGAPPSWVYRADQDRTEPLAVAPLTGYQNSFAFPPDHGDTGLLFAGSTTQQPDGLKTPVVYRCHGEICDEQVELPFGRGVPELFVSPRFAANELVFARLGAGLFRSPDGGRSFEYVDIGIDGVISSMVEGPDGTIYLSWSGIDVTEIGGVLRSHDDGATWEPLEGHPALRKGVMRMGVFADGRILVAPTGPSGGGLLCSLDGGTTWRPRCEPGQA